MLTESNLTQPLTYTGTTTLHYIGSLYYEVNSAKVYRYVKGAAAMTNDTLAAAESACADSGGSFVVNNDFAGGTGLGTIPMGLAIGALAENAYGWLQVCGLGTCITDGAVAAGEYVVNDTANDGDVDTMAAGEENQVFGYTYAADVGTVGTILLIGLI